MFAAILQLKCFFFINENDSSATRRETFLAQQQILRELVFFLDTVMRLQKYEGKGSKHVVLQIPK